MKKLSILGSTGSIGSNSLQVARYLKCPVVALATKSNIEELEKQIVEFKPQLVAVYDKKQAEVLKKRLRGQNLPEIVSGLEGVCAVGRFDKSEFVISAIAGTMGVVPTIAAIQAKKNIGLANKEVMVSAGEIIMGMAKESGSCIIPIDSEHSAIFQCLIGEDFRAVKRLIITASGGPFRGYTLQKLKKVSLQQALYHPTWKMGVKNTIDSSTLMNKALEVIEAKWLFDLSVDKIEVVIHPQSIVHSLVEFVDGSIKAQISLPDMRLPIQYAITYPERIPSLQTPYDFSIPSKLEFYPPDWERFGCLKIGFEALKMGGSMPCFINAANEVLVHRFAQGQISWLDIADRLEKLMKTHRIKKNITVESINKIDQLARRKALSV